MHINQCKLIKKKKKNAGRSLGTPRLRHSVEEERIGYVYRLEKYHDYIYIRAVAV